MTSTNPAQADAAALIPLGPLADRVSEFATLAEAQAFHLASAPDFIRLRGYASPDDGRGFTAGRVDADPGHKAAFAVQDGASRVQWYEVVASERAAKVAEILWWGQSNAAQPFDNGTVPDETHPDALIWQSGEGFVPLEAGKGGISSDGVNHSLINFSRRLIAEGGYVTVRVVMEARSSEPISGWVGTPADRTISAGNTPRMQSILDRVGAAGGLVFTHVCGIQGEKDAGGPLYPFDEPGTYAHEREYLRRSLSDLSLADRETRWLEAEVLPREVSASTGVINDVVGDLDTVRDNVAIVPTRGFVGQDQNLTYTRNGVAVPYTLHFSAGENSELGNRMFLAARSLKNGRARRAPGSDAQWRTPAGLPGYKKPYLRIANQSVQLSSTWARGSRITVVGECDVTLLADDVRGNAQAAAGNFIEFYLIAGARLNLTAETVKIFDAIRGGGSRTSISRIGRLGQSTLALAFDGTSWVVTEDCAETNGSGAFKWRWVDGQLEARGFVNVGASSGSFTDVTFPPTFPALSPFGALAYSVVADGGCVTIPSTISPSGFRLQRAATISNVTQSVRWHLMGGWQA